MLREPAVLEKMGMGRTSFHVKYIATGRAHWIYDGRMKRMPEHEVDRLIAEDIAAAATKIGAPVKPAFPRTAMLKGARSRSRVSA
jgi:hypothetical protein